MKTGLLGSASLFALAAASHIPSSSRRREPTSPPAPVDSVWNSRRPATRANPKQKECGPKRKKSPSVRSKASHHNARYMKREKKRRRKAQERQQKERLRFRRTFLAHMRNALGEYPVKS